MFIMFHRCVKYGKATELPKCTQLEYSNIHTDGSGCAVPDVQFSTIYDIDLICVHTDLSMGRMKIPVFELCR